MSLSNFNDIDQKFRHLIIALNDAYRSIKNSTTNDDIKIKELLLKFSKNITIMQDKFEIYNPYRRSIVATQRRGGAKSRKYDKYYDIHNKFVELETILSSSIESTRPRVDYGFLDLAEKNLQEIIAMHAKINRLKMRMIPAAIPPTPSFTRRAMSAASSAFVPRSARQVDSLLEGQGRKRKQTKKRRKRA